jgi:hypothetical protein
MGQLYFSKRAKILDKYLKQRLFRHWTIKNCDSPKDEKQMWCGPSCPTLILEGSLGKTEKSL